MINEMLKSNYDYIVRPDSRIMELHPILRNPAISVKVRSQNASEFCPCATSTPARTIKSNKFGLLERSPTIAASHPFDRRHSYIPAPNADQWGADRFSNGTRDSHCPTRRASLCPPTRIPTPVFSRPQKLKNLVVVNSDSEDDFSPCPKRSFSALKNQIISGSSKTIRKSLSLEKQESLSSKKGLKMRVFKQQTVQEVIQPSFPEVIVGDLDVYADNVLKKFDHCHYQPVEFYDMKKKESEDKVFSWFEKNEEIDRKGNHPADFEEEAEVENKAKNWRRKRTGTDEDVRELVPDSEINRTKKQKLTQPNNLPIKEVTNLMPKKANQRQKKVAGQDCKLYPTSDGENWTVKVEAFKPNVKRENRKNVRGRTQGPATRGDEITSSGNKVCLQHEMERRKSAIAGNILMDKRDNEMVMHPLLATIKEEDPPEEVVVEVEPFLFPSPPPKTKGLGGRRPTKKAVKNPIRAAQQVQVSKIITRSKAAQKKPNTNPEVTNEVSKIPSSQPQDVNKTRRLRKPISKSSLKTRSKDLPETEIGSESIPPGPGTLEREEVVEKSKPVASKATKMIHEAVTIVPAVEPDNPHDISCTSIDNNFIKRKSLQMRGPNRGCGAKSRLDTDENLNVCNSKEKVNLPDMAMPSIFSIDNIENWNKLNGKEGILFSRLNRTSAMSYGYMKLLPYTMLAKNTICAQVWTILQGKGKFSCNDLEQLAIPGNMIYIPSGADYTIQNIGQEDFVLSYFEVATTGSEH